MQPNKFDVEFFRRNLFHFIDLYAAEQNFQLYRAAHFIERLNLRATDQKEALTAFASAVKRAAACEDGKKISIHMNGHTFLFRTEASKTKRVIHCVTYSFISEDIPQKHFSDADIKLTFKKKS